MINIGRVRIWVEHWGANFTLAEVFEILGINKAVWNQWTGLLDWNTGLEYWNGLNYHESLFLDMTAF